MYVYGDPKTLTSTESSCEIAQRLLIGADKGTAVLLYGHFTSIPRHACTFCNPTAGWNSMEQDGPLLHSSLDVSRLLTETCPGRWIGPNIKILRERIMKAMHAVTGDMLGITWQEIDHRLDVLRVTREIHIEVL